MGGSTRNITAAPSYDKLFVYDNGALGAAESIFHFQKESAL